MQQEIGVDRNFAGFQFVDDNLAVLLDIVDCLIEYVVVVRLAFAIGEVSDMLRPSDEFHTAIPEVSLIDSQPHSQCL